MTSFRGSTAKRLAPVALAALALLSLPPATAQAQQGDCVRIEADLDRLACYDLKSGRTPTAKPAPGAGAWTVEVSKSDFEDTTDVYMSVTSTEPLNCRNFGTPRPATLFVRCRENTTSIYIATNCHLTSGHGGYGNVDIRLDDDKSFRAAMDESTSNNALGHFRGGKAIPLLKRMLGKEVMLTRFTPFGESAVTASFPIADISEAIQPLRTACKW